LTEKYKEWGINKQVVFSRWGSYRIGDSQVVKDKAVTVVLPDGQNTANLSHQFIRIGKTISDTVHIVMEHDTGSRVVTVLEDFQRLLNNDTAAKAFLTNPPILTEKITYNGLRAQNTGNPTAADCQGSGDGSERQNLFIKRVFRRYKERNNALSSLLPLRSWLFNSAAKICK
jgi:hypothetical protein